MRTEWAAIFSCVLWIFTFEAVLAQGNEASAEHVPAGPGLHARLYNSQLRQIEDRCFGQEKTLSCIDDFWNVADVSRDGELSVAEVTRLLRMIFGRLAHDNYLEEYQEFLDLSVGSALATPPESDEVAAVLVMAAAGPVVSHAIMANFDYDDNGLLSRQEVLHDVAADLVLTSVETLPSEVQSRAQSAIGQLLQFLGNGL